MDNRKTILISLLVLGLMLIGGGIWWKIDMSSKSENNEFTFIPIISMEATDDNIGSRDSLYICEDGSVYVIWEIGQRSDISRPWSKVYRKGQLQRSELDALIQLFRDNLSKLQESYQYSRAAGAGGSNAGVGMDTVLFINYQGLVKKIVAYDYLTMYSSYFDPDSEYRGMPAPLDKICKRLSEIGAVTEEYHRDTNPLTNN